MKRGLITWDKSEIPPEVFERRVDNVRGVLAERELPALVVYCDLWRSNQARFFSNFMPYFNRALLIIPRRLPATLLCGLSPRVYGWIRSVTAIEDVRPAGNFAQPLFEIAADRGWPRIGVLDLEKVPYDIHKALHGGLLGLVNVEPADVFTPYEDETELALRRKAAALAIAILEDEIPPGVGLRDHQFVGRLERRFRRAGVEDLIVLITNGRAAPAPPAGATLEENFSVSVAVEYRGHWVRISRPHLADDSITLPRDEQASCREQLDGAYPYECGNGKIVAQHFEFNHKGKRLFFGDTIL
jgi:hypothetical protein